MWKMQENKKKLTLELTNKEFNTLRNALNLAQSNGFLGLTRIPQELRVEFWEKETISEIEFLQSIKDEIDKLEWKN